MNSKTAPQLTALEREVLKAYRSPHSGLTRVVLLSAGYAIGAGVFAYLAIQESEPLYVVVVYAILLLVMGLRIWRGRKLARIMPGIIKKYENTIAELSRGSYGCGVDG